jgi:tRNA/tmRNA/rRNA uracil-C5-methylase (TrmA/RlmC/RlmD family)
MNKMSTKKIDECIHRPFCSGCEEIASISPPPVWHEMQTFFLEKRAPAQFFSQETVFWRMRAKLAVRQQGGLKIGLFKKKSHEVVEIPLCMAHHPQINEAVWVLKQEMEIANLSGYEEKNHKGDIRYLQLTVEKSSQKVQLVLVVNASTLDPKMELFAKTLFEKSSLWHSIWINLQPLVTNRIFGPSWNHLQGEEFLRATILQEAFVFHPAAFFQAHMALFEKMIDSIQRNLPDRSAIAEFYAGVGLIGKCCKNKASHIYLVEENPFAERSFIASLKKEEEDLFSYFCSDVDQKISLCSDAKTIIVDPPRKGISPALLEAIAQKKGGFLVYVSCYFPSFQRDVEQLLQKGWLLEKAEGYLLFPGTNHVEVIAFLRKTSG